MAPPAHLRHDEPELVNEMTKQTDLRNEVVREIKRRWFATYGRRLSDSDARAMLRGEASTEQYRFAFVIAREYGLFD